MNYKLAGWKIKFLNMASRTTLVKVSLTSMRNHVIQYILFPSKIHRLIDRTQRNFILGTTTSKRRIHMAKWDTITKPKKERGLGMQKSCIKNDTLFRFLAWRIKTNPLSLWAMVLMHKYNTNFGSLFVMLLELGKIFK